MTRNIVVYNAEAVAFPAVDAIADLLLRFAKRHQCIVLDYAVLAVLHINAEEIIVQHIVFNYYIITVLHFDSAGIIEGGIA